MTEPVTFEVPEAGPPRLGDGSEGGDDQPELEQPTQQLAIQIGWSQEEASMVVGGVIANLTLAMYAMKWKAVPDAELWPLIVGDPKSEFPLMGAGLAPILDFIAPKNSAAAVGISLTAGVGEVISAAARRAEVVGTKPKQQTQQGPAPQPQPAAAAPSAEPGGFKFNPNDLAALRNQDAYAGMGIG